MVRKLTGSTLVAIAWLYEGSEDSLPALSDRHEAGSLSQQALFGGGGKHGNEDARFNAISNSC